MKQTYLNSGTYTYKPLKGKLDLEAYIISVLAKDTCCTKTILADSITNTAGTMFAAFYPTAAQNNIAAGGTSSAISITNYLTTINTDAGGDGFTLANGTQSGQMKKILLVVDGGGDATITLTGYTSIVMNDAADFVILMWNGTAWKVLENSGSTVNA